MITDFINTDDSSQKNLIILQETIIRMRNQIIAVLIAFLLCTTLLVSAKPAASAAEQHRDISLPNWSNIPKPFCPQVLCTFPCFCGSHLDTRGCDTCSCLPCGSEW